MATKRRNETMQESRTKLIAAARRAFGAMGFTASSMDELTASVGLMYTALYHNFGDKKGLLDAVVAEIDGEMARWRDGLNRPARALRLFGSACLRKTRHISEWLWTRKSGGLCCWMGLRSWKTPRIGQARTPVCK